MSAVSYVNAERIKLVSTRSPWWCLAVAAVLAWGLTALLFGTAPADALDEIGPGGVVMGSELATVVLAVMAVLAVTSEYRFGTVRATFLAAPRRTAALVAKIGLLTVVTTLFSCAVGLLVRHSPGAITAVLLWPLLIETLITIIPKAGDHIHNWLPFARANVFSDAAPGQTAAHGTLGPWWSLAYAAGIALVLVVAGLVTARRRDA